MPRGTKTSINIIPNQVPIVMILQPTYPVNVLAIQILLNLAFHAGIPMILNGIVRPTG
jgi:hypothetical protein